jgi:hypothetical protein
LAAANTAPGESLSLHLAPSLTITPGRHHASPIAAGHPEAGSLPAFKLTGTNDALLARIYSHRRPPQPEKRLSQAKDFSNE